MAGTEPDRTGVETGPVRLEETGPPLVTETELADGDSETKTGMETEPEGLDETGPPPWRLRLRH